MKISILNNRTKRVDFRQLCGLIVDKSDDIFNKFMSIKALSNYTFYSRYARYNKDKKRRETWEEAVGRVFDMHRKKYAKQIEENPELDQLITFAQSMQNKKRVLAAQRTLQFAGDPIFKHELKVYNCLFTHIDRERVFQEIMYSLLCGCGVGFSVQKQHVSKLGTLKKPTKGPKPYTVKDSIEGWADAVGVLMDSFFQKSTQFGEYHGHTIMFDFSEIRPEGSLIAGQFKAPGSNGLKSSLVKIENVIYNILVEGESVIRPIDAYDIIMHISDAVLSGGVRRSATLCLFSHDDEEMLNAKIGDWFITNPQRARSNNSAALLKGKVSKEEFAKLMKSTKEFGEPGFIWMDDLDIGFNPCVTGDTLVKLPSPEKETPYELITMKSLVEILQQGQQVPVISFNIETGEEEIDLAKFGVKTRESANVIKIILEDDRMLKLTPNHKVLTRNRGYVEASKLTEDDDIVTDSLYDKERFQEFKEATEVNYLNQENWVNLVVDETKLKEWKKYLKDTDQKVIRKGIKP